MPLSWGKKRQEATKASLSLLVLGPPPLNGKWGWQAVEDMPSALPLGARPH